jgi:hypothetical protein
VFLARLPHCFGIKFQLHFKEWYRRNVALPREVLKRSTHSLSAWSMAGAGASRRNMGHK